MRVSFDVLAYVPSVVANVGAVEVASFKVAAVGFDLLGAQLNACKAVTKHGEYHSFLRVTCEGIADGTVRVWCKPSAKDFAKDGIKKGNASR